MSSQSNKEKPEVYAVRYGSGDWQISRRSFLKASGIGAAMMSAGLSGFRSQAEGAADKDSLADICKSAPAHNGNITNIMITPDDKYMVTTSHDWVDGHTVDVIKCWDLENGCKLLGRNTKNSLRYPDQTIIGMIRGKTCLIGLGNSYAAYYTIPFSFDAKKEILLSADDCDAITADKAGNIYVAADEEIWFYGADKDYKEPSLLYKFDSFNLIKSLFLFQDDSKLFIQESIHNCWILDLRERTLRSFDGKSSLYSFCPEGDRVLIYDDKKNTVSLRDLDSGTDAWTIDIEKRKDPSSDFISIQGIAVAKDGETGFLIERNSGNAGSLLMISMNDGSVLASLDLCPIHTGPAHLAVTSDGKKIMAALDSSVFVISLPDLRIIALPTDYSEFVLNREGSMVQMANPETGVVITKMLGRGAEIPAGSVCICNTVTGASGFCSCYGHSCTCDGHPHYWHPN